MVFLINEKIERLLDLHAYPDFAAHFTHLESNKIVLEKSCLKMLVEKTLEFSKVLDQPHQVILSNQSSTDLLVKYYLNAIYALEYFICSNWTDLLDDEDLVSMKDESLFTIDGLFPHLPVKQRGLLEFSINTFQKIILWLEDEEKQSSVEMLNFAIKVKLWLARCLFLHQRLLREHSSTLKTKIYSILHDICRSNVQDHCLFYVEFSLVKIYYGEDILGKEFLLKAESLRQFQWGFTGVKGKRTKFQNFDVSLLAVKAKSFNTTGFESITTPDARNSLNFPPDSPLVDDTLLNKEIVESSDNYLLNDLLHPIDQCILLGYSALFCSTHVIAEEAGVREEIMALIKRILKTPTTCIVQQVALYIRSLMESFDERRIERSMAQLQALLLNLSNGTKYSPGAISAMQIDRLKYFLYLNVPSKWEIACESAKLHRKTGVFHVACDLFRKLEMWDDTIECLVGLNRIKEAKELIASQIERHPSNPKLYCLMGELISDSNDKSEFYRKSWQVSQNTFSKPMYLLGKLYLHEKLYNQAIECTMEALKIFPLDEDSWFLVGYCWMCCECWNESLSAFYRIVNEINEENSRAWSNIGAVLLRQGKTLEALRAFKRALKIQFDDWKMWENYLKTAMSCGDFAESMLALRRLVELRGVDVDIDPFEIVLSGIRGKKAAEGFSEECKFIELTFEDLLRESCSGELKGNFRIWFIYGEFLWQKSVDHERIREYFENSVNCMLSNDTQLSMKKSILFNQACQILEKIVQYYKETIPPSSFKEKINQILLNNQDTFQHTLAFKSLQNLIKE